MKCVLTIIPGAESVRTTEQPRRGDTDLIKSLLCHSHSINTPGLTTIFIFFTLFILSTLPGSQSAPCLAPENNPHCNALFQSFASRTIPCVELRRDLTCGRGQGGRASPACSEEEYTAASGSQVNIFSPFHLFLCSSWCHWRAGALHLYHCQKIRFIVELPPFYK